MSEVAPPGMLFVPGKPAPRSDADRMLSMFGALELGQSDSMYIITIPGAPWSKSRPRFARSGHTYSKPEDQDAEKRTATYLRAQVRQPYTGNVGLACLFFRPNRQRIDADNLLKHVCDAANGVLWIDDSQCTAIMGVVELDADRPRTIIAVGEHISTLKRGSNDALPCQVCGKMIMRTQRMRGNPPKTCSRECSAMIRGYTSLAEPIQCAQCRKPFKRRTKAQRLCSKECQARQLSGARRALGRQLSSCVDCGKMLAHNRGGRCRDCWKSHIARSAETCVAEGCGRQAYAREFCNMHYQRMRIRKRLAEIDESPGVFIELLGEAGGA